VIRMLIMLVLDLIKKKMKIKQMKIEFSIFVDLRYTLTLSIDRKYFLRKRR